MKAEEEGSRGSFVLSLRLSLKALWFEPFLRKNLWKTCCRKHHTNFKNRMVVLRNRRPPRMHPGCADPLLQKIRSSYTLQKFNCTFAERTARRNNKFYFRSAHRALRGKAVVSPARVARCRLQCCSRNAQDNIL